MKVLYEIGMQFLFPFLDTLKLEEEFEVDLVGE